MVFNTDFQRIITVNQLNGCADPLSTYTIAELTKIVDMLLNELETREADRKKKEGQANEPNNS